MKATTSLTVHPVTNVEALRREKGWTQRELAEKAGLHPTIVSRVECGLAPGPTARSKLASAFDLSPDELFLLEPAIAERRDGEVRHRG
jgi:transcriptional regulator with XRE-family HTH domain